MINDQQIRSFASQSGFDSDELQVDDLMLELRRYTRILTDYLIRPFIFKRDPSRDGIHASGGWIIDTKILKTLSDLTIDSGFACSMEEVEAVLLALEKLPANASHDSDCALHNMPAYPNGLCDCSVSIDESKANPQKSA